MSKLSALWVWTVIVLLVACTVDSTCKNKNITRAMWLGVAAGLVVDFFLVLFWV
ncbi:MAG: hypothetical protein IKW35_07025 [Paludibacteraceae bacterium]|nr:hypothetical protein [Paludibacteraceae bacterium]